MIARSSSRYASPSASWIFVAPLILAGLLVTALCPRRRTRLRTRRLFLPNDGEHLRFSVMGRSKTEVVRQLGLPRSALIAPGVVATAGVASLSPRADASPLPADLWYYPLDTPGNWVMAVHFHNQKASEVEIFHSP